MKFWKHSLIAATAFFCITTLVTYSSCTVDSCDTLICKNGGVCDDGFCRCPDGYEGTQCKIVSKDKFLGKYYGQIQCDGNPVIIDSALVRNTSKDTSFAAIEVQIYSNGPSANFTGRVLTSKEVTITNESARQIIMKSTGENKIEIVIEKMVNGKKEICNFSGTK